MTNTYWFQLVLEKLSIYVQVHRTTFMTEFGFLSPVDHQEKY